ncbi:putative coiled-coil domain-containing protein 196 isoform X2 [Gracilinanus agilis]|uniref:putative coiled-coil domain-containing protein 196 isoform X2 n=1 Tax=Gracilinanus agilis TaxID=191870 RepID=UPI001CFDD04A|nr:putative coiled-coil domain-containing protein 196 isoform X2 [Gracilinanus agilis]
MNSTTKSARSLLQSKARRSSTVQDNYLKELNEDLKIRKEELVEILKPLEEKNGTLLQNLMTNLEEKQKSLQIMRQIMVAKGGDSDDTIVLEMIQEAEELKQNLERKNMLLRREMDLLWNKQAIEDEHRCQQKEMLLKTKAEMKALKDKLQRQKDMITFQREPDKLQELHGKVIEENIDTMMNPQANDLLLHDLSENLETSEDCSKFHSTSRYSRSSGSGQKSISECGSLRSRDLSRRSRF